MSTLAERERLIQPYVTHRDRMRERWRLHDTTENAAAYRRACVDLDIEAARLHIEAMQQEKANG